MRISVKAPVNTGVPAVDDDRWKHAGYLEYASDKPVDRMLSCKS